MAEIRRHLRVTQPEEFLQVGELAKNTGKTVRAIHLYENLGLIEPARRSEGRYRLFTPDAETRVRWINKLQNLGLSLPEIQALVENRASSETALSAANHLGQLYREKLEEVRKKLSDLHALETELNASIAYLDGCESVCQGHSAVHACQACNSHVDSTPELVLGASVGSAPSAAASTPISSSTSQVFTPKN